MDINSLKKHIIIYEEKYFQAEEKLSDNKLQYELESLEDNNEREEYLEDLLENITLIKIECDYLMCLLKYSSPKLNFLRANPTPKTPNYADLIDYKWFEDDSKNLFKFQQEVKNILRKFKNEKSEFNIIISKKRTKGIIYTSEQLERKHILQLVLSKSIKEDLITNNSITNIGAAIFFLTGKEVSSPEKIRQSIDKRKNGQSSYTKKIFDKAIEKLTNIIDDLKKEQNNLYP